MTRCPNLELADEVGTEKDTLATVGQLPILATDTANLMKDGHGALG